MVLSFYQITLQWYLIKSNENIINVKDIDGLLLMIILWVFFSAISSSNGRFAEPWANNFGKSSRSETDDQGHPEEGS